MKISRKKKSGITLVALVITIIVLLILAGVAITTLKGNNNIVTKAREDGLFVELINLTATKIS